MVPFYLLALILHAAYSLDCQDTPKIAVQDVLDPTEIVGKWTYVYHWDSNNKYEQDDLNKVRQSHECPPVEIRVADDDFIQKKKTQCAAVKDFPFKWEDAKLIFDAPLMYIENALIFVGDNENWLLTDCDKKIKLQVKRVSEDYIAIVNPDAAYSTELLSRKPLNVDEFRCYVGGIDFGRDLSGIAICY